jgi:hypothetical protein
MKKLSILTPTRDGLVDINYTSSLLATQKLLSGEWEVEPTMISGASDITSARNALFNLWYQTDVDVVMFIDSDVSWNPRDLKRWLDSGLFVVSGNYPKKAFNVQNLLKAAHLLQNKYGEVDPKKALRASFEYISTGAHRKIVKGEYEGYMLVDAVGMGMFMMRREAADVVMSWAEENMQKTKFSTLSYEKAVEGYPIFNHVMDENGQGYGEDFSFCRRLGEAGVQIFLDPKMTLRHTGTVSFDGCFQDMMDVVELAKEAGNEEWREDFIGKPAETASK